MYSETVFISKIIDYHRVLADKDCGFGPRKIDLKDPGFLLFTSSSEYEGYALTECHLGMGQPSHPRQGGSHGQHNRSAPPALAPETAPGAAPGRTTPTGPEGPRGATSDRP